MKFKTAALSLLIPFSLMITSTSHAESTAAVQEMAKVLLQIEKEPNKKQSEALKNISKDAKATENEQNLAKAILNIKDRIDDKDKPLVWGVLRSINASEGEREIAKIVNGFNQKASKDEQARLSKLLPPPPPKKESTKDNKKK